ncbi:hypothetical protein A3742_02285 [Oleiphilus sp. HI0071]|uniref:glycosyltransferase family 4 protein n=1 Tax=Oleiphilus sp. HI0080 TaxID=1822255 RepID=UPI0007C3EBB7|nr:glycosyltransferase family 4 protein [Oleiphilus sp. HI0080]KZY61029.1 hypothetical protein A3737_06075 [Oleiphilus sp. HI0065]KZY79700.1 hypothetical protein A3742_02285 [Oleiphilus sp. HI0071]KZY89757.1 hypothetical protein A3744_06295 [Oleiphilus sp. HI0073]KZZ55806.1 hypothetical protein A3760_00395 [Oleiphilus sp. HI0122]KZZ16146.1 hypothetical protein A3751_15685 [Oleiphilus sp. HI0080]
MKSRQAKQGILLVANWDSNVGFAWWLMESFWRTIALKYKARFHSYLAYPSISTVPQAIETAPIECHTINFTLSSPSSLFRQLSFIRQHNIKTIYFSDQKVAHWRYAVFKLFGVKYIIVHDHTPGERSKSAGLKGFLKSILNNSILSATALFATSDYVKARLIETYRAAPSKCYNIPNGIPYYEVSRDRSVLGQFDIPHDSTVIIGTGRANKFKGIDFALECMAQLIKQNPPGTNLVYLYCGDGPDLEHFKYKAKHLGIEGYVRFPGKVSNLDDICAAADLAFHPSEGEVGYSLSILEYMRAGLPVVVPNNPSVCLATSNAETGLIYERSIIDSAVTALLRLATDLDLRKHLGANAQRSIKNQYNLDTSHAKLIHAFEAVQSA